MQDHGAAEFESLDRRFRPAVCEGPVHGFQGVVAGGLGHCQATFRADLQEHVGEAFTERPQPGVDGARVAFEAVCLGEVNKQDGVDAIQRTGSPIPDNRFQMRDALVQITSLPSNTGPLNERAAQNVATRPGFTQIAVRGRDNLDEGLDTLIE
ncbi:hypothetical protein Aple_050830 [Acrocarpospora pleiomorpha]|uniref:Uncharacterized protein n=1 Tax=Acrocarpospora pleiomorpha TaxID=90975 RepID=A0A5M3XN72_9ACTN|nr:hypothetical protein Aple_050830 [Acrocarpospora pleiomorpha]